MGQCECVDVCSYYSAYGNTEEEALKKLMESISDRVILKVNKECDNLYLITWNYYGSRRIYTNNIFTKKIHDSSWCAYAY